MAEFVRDYALQFVARQQLNRAACDAAYWLRTYCRHWATIGHDTQTIDNLNTDERVIARQHIGTLRRLGMIREGGFRGNFEILTITPSQR